MTDLLLLVGQQYALETGVVEAVWRTPGSPRVTCPQWMRVEDEPRIVLTTAVEGMSPEQRARHPHAGSLFMAEAPQAGAVTPSPFPFPE